MTDRQLHRQLLSATKLLVHQLEVRCHTKLPPGRRPWGTFRTDNIAITAALRAIAESHNLV